jgi:hypothetical protein
MSFDPISVPLASSEVNGIGGDQPMRYFSNNGFGEWFCSPPECFDLSTFLIPTAPEQSSRHAVKA